MGDTFTPATVSSFPRYDDPHPWPFWLVGLAGYAMMFYGAAYDNNLWGLFR